MRVLLPRSGAQASVSANVSVDTLNALDEMMTQVQAMFPLASVPPKAKPCGDITCHHSRRQHLHKLESPHIKGVRIHYGACRVRGCKCVAYYEGER